MSETISANPSRPNKIPGLRAAVLVRTFLDRNAGPASGVVGDVVDATSERPPAGFLSQTMAACIHTPTAGPLVLAPVSRAVLSEQARNGRGQLRFFAYELGGGNQARILWDARQASRTHPGIFAGYGEMPIGELRVFESKRGAAVAPGRGLAFFRLPAGAESLPALEVCDYSFVEGTEVVRFGEPGLLLGGTVADVGRQRRANVMLSVAPHARAVGSPVVAIWGEPDKERFFAMLLKPATRAEDAALRLRIPHTSYPAESLRTGTDSPGYQPVRWFGGVTGGKILQLLRDFDAA